jgi:uncharacterized Zn-binding protein involved in type VI secretion
MGQPAARQNDRVQATDIHIILVPSPGGPVPTPTPHPFSGPLLESLSADVLIDGRAAATQGSVALNIPPHVPQGGTFQIPPTNRGTVQTGSATVFINDRLAARMADHVMTCFDTPGAPGVIVEGSPTVVIG